MEEIFAEKPEVDGLKPTRHIEAGQVQANCWRTGREVSSRISAPG